MSTMIGFSAFVAILHIGYVATFSPTVTVSCSVGPSYTFTTTGESATGVIFIDGVCAAQTTDGGPYTFTDTECSGSAPALGTEFKLVIQEYATINLATDSIVKVTCTLDTSNVEKVVSVSASGEDFDTTDTGSVSPTFTVAVEDSIGDPLTSGTIGDAATIKISIPAAEALVFDYQVTGLDIAATDTVTLITAGCPDFSAIIAQPSSPTAGVLSIPFNLFIPKDTSTSAALPGTSAVSVTFTFDIKVCDTSCPAVSCTRKKRSIENSNSTIEVELATSLVIYPAGHKPFAKMAPSNVDIEEDEKDVCLSKTPLIGVLVALSGALIVCMGITVWLFCRLRNPIKGDRNDFTNMGFKS
ncbi:uncharacterized protein LOC132738386 [Ruditapes philippinarum]|uniref:uncharacterized protein LOC132738386 n=1 Tax=Ruditapes philippinarum TaxID=129788 RepID=UPI00295BCBEB|nr:uncharacterized protein LOC132738386 [Ruditapes philippinarum]